MSVLTTREAVKLRSHIKFLVGDFLSFELLSTERGGNPKCRLCPACSENTQHILAECAGTAETRQRLYQELLNQLAKQMNQTTPDILTQFILDPTSMNLPNGYRISTLHPRLHELFSLSRDWCHSVVTHRARLLKTLKTI